MEERNQTLRIRNRSCISLINLVGYNKVKLSLYVMKLELQL